MLFAVLYWLNPWRLYFSGFLWNPNYLFLFGGASTSGAPGGSASGRASALVRCTALALGLAFQIHASVLLLAVASALLLLAAAHCGCTGRRGGGRRGARRAPLVPWVLAARRRRRQLLPVRKGFLGRGLLLVFPLLRGLLYWLRYASLGLSENESRFDFAPELGGGRAGWLRAAGGRADAAARRADACSLPLLANVWLWRRLRRRGCAGCRQAAAARAWVRGYACASASPPPLVAFALAPTTIMWWQGVIAAPRRGAAAGRSGRGAGAQPPAAARGARTGAWACGRGRSSLAAARPRQPALPLRRRRTARPRPAPRPPDAARAARPRDLPAPDPARRLVAGRAAEAGGADPRRRPRGPRRRGAAALGDRVYVRSVRCGGRAIMEVTFKLLTGKTFILDVDAAESVERVQTRIAEQEGVLDRNTADLRRQDATDGRTLADYNIQQHSTVHVVARFR